MAHGVLPIPAPATANLLQGKPTYSNGVQRELVTPTGAAIVATLCDAFGPQPPMSVTAIGYGAGTADLEGQPNVVRIMIGEAAEKTVGGFDEEVAVIEANLDDMNPQIYGYFLERALAAGALDVYTTPVQMKKNRPGTLLTVLCKLQDTNALMSLIFAETTTFGARMYRAQRRTLPREFVSVATNFGDVRIKISRVNGRILHVAPEYDDCRKLAVEKNVPLQRVITEALRAYETGAKTAGVPESEFVAKMAAEWKALWDELGIPSDEFIRTTDLKHAHTVQWLFKLCRENGFVYPGHYTGQYCIYDNAYVDVKAGENCPDCGRPTETVTEANYFFKLSAFQKPLLHWYAKHPEFIQPESRRNEILSFVEGGLRDLSITRTSVRWGIPVPGEEPHVFYVWFDALTAYLSAVGGPEFEKRGMWPADLHLVGKDIIRFHTVYWPAFLMAAMQPVPKQVWAHGWFLMDAAKMSKSKGNVVLPRPIANMLGMDALRYFLLREVVFGQDGNFSYDALVTRYNSDLANGLGNLASRTAAMIDKNFGGKIPEAGKLQAQDETIARETQSAIGDILEHFEKMEFARALESIWAVVAAADKYLTKEQPWALGDSEGDTQRKATILSTTAELLRIVTALAHPVLPESTAKVWMLLGQPGSVSAVELDGLRWGQLASGVQLGKAQNLVRSVEKSEGIERIDSR